MRRFLGVLALVSVLALLLVNFTRISAPQSRGAAPDADALLAAMRRAAASEARAAAAEARATAAEARAAAASAAAGSTPPMPGLGKPDNTETNRKLEAALQRVANERKEVMLSLANDVMMCTNRKTCWWNGGNVLETFLESLRRLQLRNSLVITLDDATEAFCTKRGDAPSLRLELPVPSAQQNSRGANMISTLKYGLLRQSLLMGFSILVVDLDLVFLKDPFLHLYRDADIEASTDGFSKSWAGGQISSVHEPKMGWGGGGLYVQHFTLNVGCAFLRPTPRAVLLLERVADQLSKAAAWDQQVFNSEAFMLSHGSYNGSGVAVRVMQYDQFMNSKVFFFSERRRFFPGRLTAEADWPVMVHFNYHPDKHKRMLCVWERYVGGKPDACDSLPQAG
uniref:Nucleotide-diphospho-sugar transferase domain-containing protein n=2 Tax=Emiliania huxleyi TaxID=2903 RepID=A0A6T0ADR2_EMIHU|mmetsp:Transcript_13726/g.44694  ORF Transcript_13726/g.44694 Transcript_13726/m.44694 type:complete len:395 (+) Transcript_13726:45-1229(+)